MERFMLILFLSILITMVKTTSIASQDISVQSKCLVNQKKKIKRKKRVAQCYSNYIATYRINLSGDIETNPRPGLSKPKCQVCDKTDRCNQKRFVCEHCLEMCHVKWSNHQLNQNASNKAYEWTCSNCIHTALPFCNRRNLDFDSTVADETTILHANNCHIETLKNYQKYASIVHINCQSILSTFDEFPVMLKSYEFDIISLSETWLTNNQHQLDYINIADYKSISKHRNDKRGGGAGFYIKDNIYFKTRNDLKKKIVNMEVTFIKLHGRNKSTPT